MVGHARCSDSNPVRNPSPGAFLLGRSLLGVGIFTMTDVILQLQHGLEVGNVWGSLLRS